MNGFDLLRKEKSCGQRLLTSAFQQIFLRNNIYTTFNSAYLLSLSILFSDVVNLVLFLIYKFNVPNSRVQCRWGLEGFLGQIGPSVGEEEVILLFSLCPPPPDLTGQKLLYF